MGGVASILRVWGPSLCGASLALSSVMATGAFAESAPPLPQSGRPFGSALQGASCDPGIVFSDLVIPPGSVHFPRADVCEIKVQSLSVGKGSGIHVPASCKSFDLTAENAEFDGGNVIFGATRKLDFSQPSARPGPAISITIGVAHLDFPPQTSGVSEEWVSRFAFGTYISHGTASLPAPVKDLGGIAVVSFGETGLRGKAGSKGAPARRKGCNGDSGHPAGSGGRGGTGDKGGPGGAITLDLTVASAARNTVTGYDVQLFSVGGNGGEGGPGGQGGDGAAARSCASGLYKRSGFLPGKPGPTGGIGPTGDPGPVAANIRMQ